MRRLAAVMLGLLCAPAASAAVTEEPIIGGTTAARGQYPSVVAIQAGNALCSGTLITNDWVLTAAHCVTPSEVGVTTQAELTASVRVHVGTVNLHASAGTVIAALETIPDPAFDMKALGSHDAGLIHLATPVSGVTLVPIDLLAGDAGPGLALTMVGFGLTKSGTQTAGTEYAVAQTSIACSSLGSDANLLCYSQTAGSGTCSGDSGGPSFVQLGGRQVQVGITSFGDDTCTQFGADTRIDAERAFVLAHVPALACTSDASCASGSVCYGGACMIEPFAATGLGASCTTNTDCASAMCTGNACTMACTDTCPDGFTCSAAHVCDAPAPATGSGGGCETSGGAGAGAMLALIGLVAVRRRR